jgi:hypothetical protein
MRMLKLTQANTNAVVEVATTNIFYVYYSDAHKATHIVANGGAYLAVLESLDHVSGLIRGSHDVAPAFVKEESK